MGTTRSHHVTTWSSPRHPHANRPFPIDAILADLPSKRGAGLPRRRNLTIAGHRQQPVSVPQPRKAISPPLFPNTSRANPPSHTSRFTYLALYLPLAHSKNPYRTKLDGCRSQPSRKAVSPRATPWTVPSPSSRPRPHPPPGGPTIWTTQTLPAPSPPP